jgi:hypothetical protein
MTNAQDEDRAALGQDAARIGPTLKGALRGQVAHLAMPAGSQPGLKDREMRRRIGRGHAEQVETQQQGLGLEGLTQGDSLLYW